jgi:hypothetical protein
VLFSRYKKEEKMRQFQLRLGVVALALLSTGQLYCSFCPYTIRPETFCPSPEVLFLNDLTPRVTFLILQLIRNCAVIK